MTNLNSKLIPAILLKNSGLIKAGNSIQITNKILEEHSQRELVTKYKSVIIGTQEWMTENLSVECFRNGDPIPEARTNEEWEKAGKEQKPAWCNFNNDPANSKKCGKIYNWYAVNDPRGLVPLDWHIPSIVEWKTLINFLGGSDSVITKLNSIYGWEFYSGLNSKDFKLMDILTKDFSGILNGNNHLPSYFNAYFYRIPNFGLWWSSTQTDSTSAWHVFVYNDKRRGGVSFQNHRSENCLGLSVRCVKDTRFNSVIIGEQEWMTENLTVECFRNGEPIQEAKTKQEWERAGFERRPAWCYSENSAINAAQYGKLYNWYAVNDLRGLAPNGWHIPRIEEWKILVEHLEDRISLKNEVGEYLPIVEPQQKLKSTSGWGRYNWSDFCANLNPYRDDGNGTNDSGFNALPSGNRESDGTFSYSGEKAFFWSTSNKSMMEAFLFVLHTNNIFHSLDPYPFFDVNYMNCGLSIRCIKD